MVLNIRNVPEDAMRELKAEAAMLGLTLREHCLNRLGVKYGLSGNAGQLRSDAKEDSNGTGNGSSVSLVRDSKSKPKRVHSVQHVRTELDERTRLQSPSTCPHGCFSVQACRKIMGGC
jgi:hypothetical protein